MTALTVKDFGGMVPILDSRALTERAPTMAFRAINCRFMHGTLDSFKEPLSVGVPEVATAIDFYHFLDATGQSFFAGFDYLTDVVRAPIVNDNFARLYVSNQFGAFITTQDMLQHGTAPSIPLGVPDPEFTALVVTPTGGTPPDPSTGIDLNETRVYIATYQSQYGEEGQASDPITVVGPSDATWAISGLTTLIAADAAYSTLEKLNIYRSISSSQQTQFFRIASLALNNLNDTYVDGLSAVLAAQQPMLQSALWAPPPEGLHGLVASPNGFLVGFKDRTVYFSEPYYPHAWPVAYALSVEDDIVGLGVFGATVVICTAGRPYLAVGSSPGALSLIKNADSLPCLSQRSIVSVGNTVLYASQDGIVAVTSSGAAIATAAVISPRQWRETYYPASIFATAYNGAYLAFYTASTGATGNGFLFDPTSNMSLWTEIVTAPVLAARQSYAKGRVNLLAANEVFEWDAGTNRMQYTWTSGEYLTPFPLNFGAVVTRSDGAAAVNIQLVANDRMRWEHAAVSRHVYRLPTGYKADRWMFTLTGTTRLYEINIATNPVEFGAVA